jgi:MFS family permease
LLQNGIALLNTYRFLALYTLAWAGGAVAYVPFLTILLPLRVTALTGAADVSWLAYMTFVGAIAASLANIGFGWASDITKVRRPWILSGLILTVVMLVVIAMVDDPVMLIGAILLWQVGLNMMLAPLAAWAVDHVPNTQKGVLGGLTALAPAIGALAGIIITIPGLAGPGQRLAIVGCMVAALVVPLLLFGGKKSTHAVINLVEPSSDAPAPTRNVMLILWAARLFIQIAEAALFAYILFYFRSIDPSFRDADVARLLGGVLVVSVPFALVAGHWMDRSNVPVRVLLISVVLAAIGLSLMAGASRIAIGIAGYALFGLGSAVFLALHSGQILRVLHQSQNKGRSLGFFNLTNTLPALIVPWLTMLIVPKHGFEPLIWLLAALAFIAAALLAAIMRALPLVVKAPTSG